MLRRGATAQLDLAQAARRYYVRRYIVSYLIVTMADKSLDPAALQRAAADACGLMKVLAHPDRLMLLCQLAHQGEMSVSELERALGIHQPTLSQQLTVLRDEALVDTRREGRYVHYRVRRGPALRLLRAVHAEFCKRRRTAKA